MSEIVKKHAQLPLNLDDIGEGLAQSFAPAGSSSRGYQILKLDKGGKGWSFGQDNNPVQEGSRWRVDTGTAKKGYVVWSESKIVAESMYDGWDRNAPPMPLGNHPTGQPYKEQRSVELRCLDGEDAGQEVLYKISSGGGNERLSELIREAGIRIVQFKHVHKYLYPVVELDCDSYPNTTHGGRTYKPIFNLVGWSDHDGNMEGDVEALEAPEQPKATQPPPSPAKPSKPPLRAVETPSETVEDRPAGQRRRRMP